MVKNEKGQLIIEAILIMVLFLGVSRLVATSFKDNEFVKKLVKTPWVRIQAILETGVWNNDITAARQSHPNYNHRHISLRGDDPEKSQ